MNKLQKPMIPYSIANCFLGLQSMSCNDQAVKEYMRAAVRKLEGCHEVFSGKNISMSMYGLKGMSSAYAEVQDTISLLAKKVKDCETFDGQNCTNILFAMQNMSSQREAVKLMLRAVTFKMEIERPTLNGMGMCNSLYGLRNMNVNDIEVRDVLKVLVWAIRKSVHLIDRNDPSTAQDVNMAINTLERMEKRIEDEEAQELVEAVKDTLLKTMGPSRYQKKYLNQKKNDKNNSQKSNNYGGKKSAYRVRGGSGPNRFQKSTDLY